MNTKRQRTTRGTIAKVLIALAVLAPAGLLLSVFVSQNFGHYVVWNRRLVQMMFLASAGLLGLGLLLHRGEDL